VRPSPSRCLRSFFFLFSLLFAFSSRADADTDLNDAVLQLAGRVAAIPNLRGPVRLEFLQDANFQTETGKEWQEIFRKEMEYRHIALSEDSSAFPLRIGLAKTPTQLILSAAVHVADKDEVRFLAIPRSAFRATSLPVAPIRVERQLVYQSVDRIFDASSLWNGAEGGMALLIAQNSDLSVLRIDSSGQIAQTVALAAELQPSRDPHAELAVHAADVTVLLPSKACDFGWAAATEAKCHLAKTFWRSPTILTPPCDASGWKLFVDGADWSTPDSLQVVPASQVRRGSADLLSNFPGPILSINGDQNPAAAFVVTRNLQTGNYEVYKITLACGN
jgi:hypothetical protein